MPDQEDLGVLLSKIAVDVADLKKGLSEGRSELRNFQSMAQEVGSKVKEALAFVGISIGIYELVSALKEFATEAALTGARTETLQIAATQIGKTYGMSAESVQYYVDKVKSAGITTQESLSAISKFLTSGLSLDQLKELATRARDIGVIAGTNTSETLGRIVQGIVSGEVEVLRRLMIPIANSDQIYKRYAESLGTTAEQLNQVQKRQAVLNEVLQQSAGFAGVAAEADASVGKQIASMARFAEEARNALWALFQPIMLQGVQNMTQGWIDLKAWADANRTSLMAWGKEIAGWVQEVTNAIRATVRFVQEHQALIKTVLELVVFSKAAGWVLEIGASLAKTIPKILEATGAITGLKLACTGPWSIVITVAVAGLAYGLTQIRNLHKELDDLQKKQAEADHGPVSKPGEAFDLGKRAAALGIGPRGRLSPELAARLQKEGDEALAQKAREEAAAAQKKAEAESPKGTGAKSGSGKGTVDSLLAPYLAMLKAKRDAELQDAKNSLDLLKETDSLKKAELERALAAQEIDGATYYQSLQELQRQETAAALVEIDKKRQAQEKAYHDLLAQLEADQKLTPEAKDIARQKLEAENKKAILVLDAEAAKTRLDGEVKVTEELKRQAEIRRDYRQKTEDLNLETAQLLGAVSEQEATLQKLYLDWQRAKQEAMDKGAYSPEYAAALERNYEAKKAEAKWGGIGDQFTQGISSLVSSIASGTQDLLSSANSLFKGLIDEALKPGLKALKNALQEGFQSLFGESMSGLGSALMGAVGVVGMLLTRSSSSSWSPSGVTSAVTSSQAVRGIIAGETSIPIGQIGESLKDALVETNGYLAQIEQNTRGGTGGGGGMNINVNASGLQQAVIEAIRSVMDDYFRDVYLQGAH
jgi:hypothetical protein